MFLSLKEGEGRNENERQEQTNVAREKKRFSKGNRNVIIPSTPFRHRINFD